MAFSYWRMHCPCLCRNAHKIISFSDIGFHRHLPWQVQMYVYARLLIPRVHHERLHAVHTHQHLLNNVNTLIPRDRSFHHCCLPLDHTRCCAITQSSSPGPKYCTLYHGGCQDLGGAIGPRGRETSAVWMRSRIHTPRTYIALATL